MKNKIIVLLTACLIAFITTVTIKNFYDNQIAQEKRGTPADSSDDAYFNAGGGILSLDFLYSSLKVMGAYFYEWNDELYLIGGTEVASGIYNKAANSVFVFNVTAKQLVAYEKVKNSISITNFCDAGDDIYFGTISVDSSNGSTVYRWNKKDSSLYNCTHIEGAKGIYDIGVYLEDSTKKVVIATSDPLEVWVYNTEDGLTTRLGQGFSDEKFIRSVSIEDEFIYLGIGSRADFIRMDARTGKAESIRLSEFQEEAFVYDQFVSHGKIYMLMSPSYQVVEYDVNTESFAIAATYDPYDNYECLYLAAEDCDRIHILGNIFFYDRVSDKVRGKVQGGSEASYIFNGVLYGVDSSGLVRAYNSEKLIEVFDLYEFVDCEYTVPTKYVVYDSCVYIPGRRFVKYDLKNGDKKVYLVSDEPQAVFCDYDGIYTANYTECTLYFYPWGIFDEKSYSVDMNSEEFLMADIDNQCRPYDIERSTDGRYVFLASGPLYGKFGGGISVYDCDDNVILYSDLNVVPNQRITDVCNSSFENCIWLATDAYGENTSPAKLDESPHIVLYNYIEKQVIKDVMLEKEDVGLGSLVEKKGHLYIRNHYGNMIVYDINEWELIFRDTKIWRSIDLINDEVVANDGQKVISIIEIENQRIINSGFKNLTGMTADKTTGKVYGFENEKMVQINGE